MSPQLAPASDVVAQSYRRKAAQCLAEAEKAPTLHLKAEWVKMADRWLMLAETAER